MPRLYQLLINPISSPHPRGNRKESTPVAANNIADARRHHTNPPLLPLARPI